MEKYSHKIDYYQYKDKVIGVVPSLDKVFIPKNKKGLPQSILSDEKPIFHSSYKRKERIKRVFVLTNACNLQCSYCFEGDHVSHKVMDPDFIENSIKKMFEDALASGKKIISFSLFGGEPSMNWSAVERAISVAKEYENRTGVKCYKAIVTNGVMSKEHINFLADNLDFVYFSFDGPKELFLLQRKPKGGDLVYETIFKNAQEVYKKGTYLAFKVTVTAHTISHMQEIEDFFTYHFPTCSRLYQPCMVDAEDELYISFGDFLNKFLELKRYTVFPKNLSTSLYKNKPSDRFCNLMVRNVIYPDGAVLTCHRSNMCVPDDAVEKEFKVGICNADGTIVRNESKQAYMEKFKVDNIRDCNECSLKYHCCGGCSTIKLLSSDSNMFRKADYCQDFIRYTFTDIFSRLFEKQFVFMEAVPEHIIFDTNIQVGYEEFENQVAEKIIRIEE